MSDVPPKELLVNRLCGKRRRGHVQYEVDWLHFPDDATWEPWWHIPQWMRREFNMEPQTPVVALVADEPSFQLPLQSPSSAKIRRAVANEAAANADEMAAAAAAQLLIQPAAPVVGIEVVVPIRRAVPRQRAKWYRKPHSL
jgi:hypothetical protein